jgi:Mrr N-terminal domain
MAVIRISDVTLEKIKRLAIPFEDKSPEHVIVRALDALEKMRGGVRAERRPEAIVEARPKHTRERTSGATGPRRNKFRPALMEAVYELGGEATTDRVRSMLVKKLSAHLDASDRKTVLSTDEPRWWNDVKWLRNDLVSEGVFRKGSKHGVWELTDAGVKAVETGRSR